RPPSREAISRKDRFPDGKTSDPGRRAHGRPAHPVSVSVHEAGTNAAAGQPGKGGAGRRRSSHTANGGASGGGYTSAREGRGIGARPDGDGRYATVPRRIRQERRRDQGLGTRLSRPEAARGRADTRLSRY